MSFQCISDRISVGSVWKGRGLKVRVLRVGLGVVWVERLDIPSTLSPTYRIYPWVIESLKGLSRIK